MNRRPTSSNRYFLLPGFHNTIKETHPKRRLSLTWCDQTPSNIFFNISGILKRHIRRIQLVFEFQPVIIYWTVGAFGDVEDADVTIRIHRDVVIILGFFLTFTFKRTQETKKQQIPLIGKNA